jgi:periplasmic divalent cation tolerance protein
VQKRLAGCVQIIGPISSAYWWKNRIESAEEWLCLIKSEKGLYKELEKTVKEVHPYETPEITAVSLVAGNREYFAWLGQELNKQSHLHFRTPVAFAPWTKNVMLNVRNRNRKPRMESGANVGERNK